MKGFKQFILENKYSDIDVSDIKNKKKYHTSEYGKLSNEIVKHNKTSPEHRHIKNDISNHLNALNSYDSAERGIKNNFPPSYIKSKIKSAENYASKISNIIPDKAKTVEKIKNIHDHIKSMLTADGFSHHQSTEEEKTNYTRRLTPYGDSTPINLRGKRTNIINTYTKPGSSDDAKKVKTSLKKDNLLGERGNHYISVYHKNNLITVKHHITGKSVDDSKHNEKEYNYVTAAHLDPVSWNTRYSSWKNNK